MKKTELTKAMALVCGAMLVTACASKGNVEDDDTFADEGTPVVEEAAQANGIGDDADVAASEVNAQARAAMQEAWDVIKDKTTFYFEFDNSSVKEDQKELLNAHANYLANNSEATVVLEGHADERGTVEYNLALGERRAIAVRSYLMANGVEANQIETTSYGEERPAAYGSDEAAYEQNRRVEIKYK